MYCLADIFITVAHREKFWKNAYTVNQILFSKYNKKDSIKLPCISYWNQQVVTKLCQVNT